MLLEFSISKRIKRTYYIIYDMLYHLWLIIFVKLNLLQKKRMKYNKSE